MWLRRGRSVLGKLGVGQSGTLQPPDPPTQGRVAVIHTRVTGAEPAQLGIVLATTEEPD